MERICRIIYLYISLEFVQICYGFPINNLSTLGWNEQSIVTFLVVLISLCAVSFLLGCICCHRRSGFKEFRDSPVSASIICEDDPGHINPIATSEFTIFTPLSPPHHNNNVFRSSQPRPIAAQGPSQVAKIEIDGFDLRCWFDGSRLEFPRNKLKYIRELGNGWFGRVVEGEAESILEENVWTPVAVRILETSASAHEQAIFLNEASMYRLNQTHPNVLQLLGHSLDAAPLLLIQEYCSRGDLKKFLLENESSVNSPVVVNLPLRFSCQLAAALQYLHENDLPHMDLAARTCQLKPDLTLKLGDYGTAVSQYPNDYYQGVPAIPVRWCAPETINYTHTTLQPKPTTKEANIWSLGVTMWEICQWGSQPYKNLTDDEVISQVLGPPNVRLPKPNKFDAFYIEHLYKLMQLCWSMLEVRPNVQHIYDMLIHLLQVSNNDTPHKIRDFSSEEFDTRWENFKPNTIVKTDNQETEKITDISSTSSESYPETKKSPSLTNLHGSFENLLTVTPNVELDSWLQNVASDTGDMSYVQNLSQAIGALDSALASEQTSSSSVSFPEQWEAHKIDFKIGEPIGKNTGYIPSANEPSSLMDSLLNPRNESSSETEDETWRKRIERGAYSEKVRQKSKSVADLMILTHIDCSESDSETPLPSLELKNSPAYKNVRCASRTAMEKSLFHGSEGNLLEIQDTFQEELKKLQEERKDSLLFVPVHPKESQNVQNTESAIFRNDVLSNEKNIEKEETRSQLEEEKISEYIATIEPHIISLPSEISSDLIREVPNLQMSQVPSEKDETLIQSTDAIKDSTESETGTKLDISCITEESQTHSSKDLIIKSHNIIEDLPSEESISVLISVGAEQNTNLIKNTCDFLQNERSAYISDPIKENNSVQICESQPEVPEELSLLDQTSTLDVKSEKFALNKENIPQIIINDEIIIDDDSKTDEDKVSLYSDEGLVDIEDITLSIKDELMSKCEELQNFEESHLKHEETEQSQEDQDLNKESEEETTETNLRDPDFNMEVDFYIEEFTNETDEKKNHSRQKPVLETKELDFHLKQLPIEKDSIPIEENIDCCRVTSDFLSKEIENTEKQILRLQKPVVEPECIAKKVSLLYKESIDVKDLSKEIKNQQESECVVEKIEPDLQLSKDKDDLNTEEPGDLRSVISDFITKEINNTDKFTLEKPVSESESAVENVDLHFMLSSNESISSEEHSKEKTDLSIRETSVLRDVKSVLETECPVEEVDPDVMLSSNAGAIEEPSKERDEEHADDHRIENTEKSNLEKFQIYEPTDQEKNYVNIEESSVLRGVTCDFIRKEIENTEKQILESERLDEKIDLKSEDSKVSDILFDDDVILDYFQSQTTEVSAYDIPLLLKEPQIDNATSYQCNVENLIDITDDNNQNVTTSEVHDTAMIDVDVLPQEIHPKDDNSNITETVKKYSDLKSSSAIEVLQIDKSIITSVKDFLNNEKIHSENLHERKSEKREPNLSSVTTTHSYIDYNNLQNPTNVKPQVYNVFNVTVDHQTPDFMGLIISDKKSSVCTSSLQKEPLPDLLLNKPLLNGFITDNDLVPNDIKFKIQNTNGDGIEDNFMDAIVTSTPFCKKVKPMKNKEITRNKNNESESSVILGPCEDYTLELYSGLKTTFEKYDDRPEEEILQFSSNFMPFDANFVPENIDNDDYSTIDYSLETWDKFLGKSLKNNEIIYDTDSPRLDSLKLDDSFYIDVDNVKEKINCREINETYDSKKIIKENKTNILEETYFDPKENNLFNKTYEKSSESELLNCNLNKTFDKPKNNFETLENEDFDKTFVKPIEKTFISTENDPKALENELLMPTLNKTYDKSQEKICISEKNLENEDLNKTFMKPIERTFSSTENDLKSIESELVIPKLNKTYDKPIEKTFINENNLENEVFDKTFVKPIEKTFILPENDLKLSESKLLIPELNETYDKPQDKTFISEKVSETDSVLLNSWEPGEGWFLHPQTPPEDLTGQMDIQTDNSYVGFALDEECVNALRNELAAKLPHAQGLASEEKDDFELEDEDLEERSEVLVKYNVFATPLSPIPEESCCDDMFCDQSQHEDGSESDSDWSEPKENFVNSDILVVDTENHIALIMGSPNREALNRHTPSQDSCCSNDTLFNLEDLNYGAVDTEQNTIEPTLKIISPEDDSDCNDTTKEETMTNQNTTTSKSTLRLNLEPINTNTAHLPSPEEIPWRQLPASMLSYSQIINETQNDSDDNEIDFEQELRELDEHDVETSENNDKELTHADAVVHENPFAHNHDDMFDKELPEFDENDLENKDVDEMSEEDGDLYNNLTDIRFSGPCDNQMMTTSFSESVEMADDRDWDSGSDTRSSSSGEFIWKEGEHEESLRALPHEQERQEPVSPMDAIAEENSESSEDDEEEVEETEFVPSAWDSQATPTKSALRSPEKNKMKSQKGVSFKKEKYHCVYEYPREPESPVTQNADLWGPLTDISKYTDLWELDPDSCIPVEDDGRDVYESRRFEPRDYYQLASSSSKHRDIYQLKSFPDFSGNSATDEDFFISSSAKPFQILSQGSQFFPGLSQKTSLWQSYNTSLQAGRDMTDNVTPDSGIDDVSEQASLNYAQLMSPPPKVQSLKTLASLAANKHTKDSLGGLRHTRNRLKLDLPPSPNSFTATRSFNMELNTDPINREAPTFTTFGKSRFSVQHVHTPTEEEEEDVLTGSKMVKNVSFEALPHKPFKLEEIRTELIDDHDKCKPEMVRGEASLLDSADEDSGIESSANATLERHVSN